MYTYYNTNKRTTSVIFAIHGMVNIFDLRMHKTM